LGRELLLVIGRAVLNRFLGWAKSSPKAARPRKAKSHLGLESLEDRLALSTVTIANRVLVYDAGGLEDPDNADTWPRF
jgi:hypothetical protein